jgi:hypothetical protein
MKQLFAMSELCSNDFYKMVEEFGIFEKDGVACVYNESFLFTILDDILVMISKDVENFNYENIIMEEVFSYKLINQNNIYANILDKLNKEEKHTILKNLFDYKSESNTYKINVDKIKLFCTKNIFYVQKEANFKLEEFISLLRNMLIVILPYHLIDKITNDNFDYSQTSGDDNIFEGYKDFDLRFLNGYCVIYFLKTQRDPLIK